jgi:hypothetical protein
MSFLTAERISALVVELLARSIVLPGTVNRVPGTDYTGSGGSTKVRIPQPRSAREQLLPGDPITYAAIDELSIDVVLSHWYDAVLISDEALTLEIVEFGKQVLTPMISAVVEAGEDQLAGAMNALAADASFALAESEADTKDVLLAARETLTKNKNPAGGRFLAVSPEIATRLLSVPEFVKVDESGSVSALRDATIGRIYGMTVFESNALTAGTALSYHRMGFAFATLAPAIPRGAGFAAAEMKDGIAIRTVMDFDPGVLSDVLAISTFGGASLVDALRVHKMDTAIA